MNEQTPAGREEIDRLGVRQKVTLMVNRYEVTRLGADGTPGDVIAFAEQKRMKLKEEVVFFTDSSRTTPLFSFKARKRLDLGSGYDVTDAAGTPIGFFRKDFGKSLLNSTWHLAQSGGTEYTGRERNGTIAVLRRLWDVIPIIGEIPVPFLFHFDFRSPDGTVVMSSEKKAGIKDVYRVTLAPLPETGARLDWRVAAAMAVALDALQSR